MSQKYFVSAYHMPDSDMTSEYVYQMYQYFRPTNHAISVSTQNSLCQRNSSTTFNRCFSSSDSRILEKTFKPINAIQK